MTALVPFAHAKLYRDLGWQGTIPLPARCKKEPPKGWTGHAAPYPSGADVQAWSETEVGNGNIALRMPADVIGIDVDAYGQKTGAATLAAREAQWGPLPATWISSSRDDGTSGIRFYRVPTGLAWPGEVGPGIEIIHAGHRYALVWPSVHPEGRVYGWTGPDRQPSEPPPVDDPPWLPAAWITGLTGDVVRGDSPHVDPADDATVATFLDQTEQGDPCKYMLRLVGEATSRILDGGSRHDSIAAADNKVMAIIRAGEQGHRGTRSALNTIHRVFTSAVAGDRRPGEAEREMRRSVAGAVAKVQATPTADPARRCCGDEVPAVTVLDNTGTSDEITPTEPVEIFGGQRRMAIRLAARYQGSLLYVYGIGWLYWDGARWAPDTIGAAERAVEETLRAALIESLDKRNTQLRGHVGKCESAAGTAGVLKLAESDLRLRMDIAALDADPHLLNCANGTLNLRTMELRGHNPLDYLTKIARGAYRPDATSTHWHTFLTRILPDGDVRIFVRQDIGQALLGKVEEHLLPIFMGTGANGKSTLYRAICWALGDYAEQGEQDLLITSKGDAGRATPHLMALRGKRLVVCSETDDGARMNGSLMKNLTGGDPITARGLFKDLVTFEPSHTTILVTNHLPEVRGDDDAVWRRIRLVNFDVVIPEAEWDTHLGDKLAGDADAILSWAVQGWVEYAAAGYRLTAPDAVKRATGAYRDEQNPIGRFIRERCVTGPAQRVKTSKLRHEFELWCEEDGSAPVTSTAFGTAIGKLPGVTRGNSSGARFYEGIGLAVVLDD